MKEFYCLLFLEPFTLCENHALFLLRYTNIKIPLHNSYWYIVSSVSLMSLVVVVFTVVVVSVTAVAVTVAALGDLGEDHDHEAEKDEESLEEEKSR